MNKTITMFVLLFLPLIQIFAVSLSLPVSQFRNESQSLQDMIANCSTKCQTAIKKATYCQDKCTNEYDAQAPMKQCISSCQNDIATPAYCNSICTQSYDNQFKLNDGE